MDFSALGFIVRAINCNFAFESIGLFCSLNQREAIYIQQTREMNISYKWLKEYVDFDLGPHELGDALTSIGLEVDSIEERPAIRGGLRGVVVGRVLTCEPHPNSDHMHVCTVDVGGAEPLQIVCGAANIAAGQTVAVATIGTTLYDGDSEVKIKKSRLRGVDSYGMICAEDEIGVGSDHSGIMVLSADARPGTPAAEYFGLQSDYCIEIDITPNRADACSHYGVARDLYAWLVRNGHHAELHRPGCEDFAVSNNDIDIDVEVQMPEACPTYCAVTIEDCKVGESPRWLQEKLEAIGLRPINNIVDITNYIMMAYGQPLHCFDADMIEGNKIVVKTMPEGTPFVTLDGVEHKLSARDLAICNAREPMCIAGVLGGKGSGTYTTTRNVLFESAYFNPTWIRKSARRHGLSTDASFRFERGIDPRGQIYALKQAAILACRLAGGKVAMNIKQVGRREEDVPPFIVDLNYEYAYTLIGKKIAESDIKQIVSSLEMEILEDHPGEGLKLAVPPYRVDVTRPCDVVEDILRIYGYNNVEIPTAITSTLTTRGEADRSHRLQNLVGEQLVGCGFNEVINNSLTKVSYYESLHGDLSLDHAVRVVNPLSSDLEVMRQTLVFGGLENIQRNLNRKISHLRLFEFGNCYHYDASRRDASGQKKLAPYSEELHMGLWLVGGRTGGAHSSWTEKASSVERESSVFELKAYVENIFQRIGISRGGVLKLAEQGSGDIWSQSLQYVSRKDGTVVAEIGILGHRWTQKFDIAPGEAYFADIRWDAAMKLTRKNRVVYAPLSKYPPVSRDLALLIDKKVSFADIERVARKAAPGELLRSVSLFDVYEGRNIAEGKKSYAVNFIMEDPARTLTDERVDKVMASILNALQRQLGAEQR